MRVTPVPPPPGCRVVVLGAPSITTATGPIPTSRPLVFAAALYLALHRGTAIRREQLATVLWPDADDATRSDRMRWLVAQLKRSGVPVLARSPEIGFPAGDVVLDVDALATAGAAAEVLAVAQGDVLAGFEPLLSDTMLRWLEETRDTMRSTLLHALEHWLAVVRQTGDWASTEALARRILSVSPSRSRASQALVEAQAMRGPGGPTRSGDARHPVRSPLVGRRRALARLLEGLEPSRSVARRFAVAGPSGIGKTRLIEEFRGVAQVRRARIVGLRCHHGDALRPLSLAIDLARALVDLRGALGASPASIEVLRHFTGEGIGAKEPSSDPSRRAAVYAALSDVVEAVTEEGPLAVVIDDAQWAEPGSWAVIAPIVARRLVTSPTWLLTLRADTLDEASRTYDAIFPPEGAEGDQEREMLWLAPLDRADVETLCVERAAPRGIPPADLCALVQRTAGVPFIAEAVVDHWLSGGNVATLPPSVTRLVDARLDRLSPAAERALTALAVLGADATPSALEAVAALGKRELLDATRELETAGILHADEDGVAPHALWTEAVLRRTPKRATMLLHGYAAAWLEQTTPRRDVAELRRHWTIAAHWIAAGEPARAQRDLDSAATALAASGFIMEGAAMVERAAEIAGASEAALYYCRRAAELYALEWTAAGTRAIMRLHRHHDAVARTIDPQGWDPHHELELIQYSAVGRERGRPGTAIPSFIACALAPTASTAHRLRAALLLLIRCTHAPYDRASVDAVWAAVAQLPITNTDDALGRDIVAAEYHGRVAGQPVIALEYAARVRGALLQRDAQHDRRYFEVLNLIADCHEFAGDLDAAQETRREMLHRGQEWKQGILIHLALNGLIGTALDAGRIAEARVYLPLFERPVVGDLLDTVLTRKIYRAVCALEEGDVERAKAEFPTPLEAMPEIGTALHHARLLAIHAHIALLEDDDETMRALLPRLMTGFVPPTVIMDHSAYVVATGLTRLGRAEEAAAFVAHYVESCRAERWTPRAELLRFLKDAAAAVEDPAAD